jgi:hypothetical protein
MIRKNAFYAQSGGVTAVINASACGLIETARRHRGKIGKIYAGRDGIIGALTEDMIDVSKESNATIKALRHTPGGAELASAYLCSRPLSSHPSGVKLLLSWSPWDAGAIGWCVRGRPCLSRSVAGNVRPAT